MAEVLAAEVSINIQYLAVAFVSRNPSKVPPDFRLSTTVFESVVGRLGELPPALVGEVVFLYRYFEELNRLPEKYVGYVNDLRSAMAADTNRRNQIDREIQACVDVYNSYLDKCIDRLDLVQPMLLNVAFPFWSPRTLAARPLEESFIG
ncbi:MAG: hypothetical protein ACREIH_02285 [Nitrospiraceae bacterium]